MYEKNDITGFPSVISLFSAPCYAGHDNDAAILCYKNNAITIKKFYHVDHPYYLPMFQNVCALF
jgi:serine/threonine-protein phosphatase 2B catalytic subunit